MDVEIKTPSNNVHVKEPLWFLTLVSLSYRNFRLVWLGSASEHIGEFMEVAAVL